MIIAQLTDTHILSPTLVDSSVAKQRINDLKSCIDSINRLKPRADAVIHTGDLTQTADLSEYEIALSLLNNLVPPFFVIPGNRDSRKNMRKVFFLQALTKKMKILQFCIPLMTLMFGLLG